MDQMAFYNDSYFDLNYSHKDDKSLICQNNTLYYTGETKTIYGMIKVEQNERVNLYNFRMSNLNNNQWNMQPHQLFFYIRESIKLSDIDVKESIMNIYKAASKSYLLETDKLSLIYTVDYFNALKTIENYLSGDLFDAYKYMKDMFTTISTMNQNTITPGFRLMYEKIFGEIQDDLANESSSNANGIARTRFTGPKPPTPVPIYQNTNTDNIDDNQKFNNAAFISVVALVILMLAIVIGTMTYIFS
ncbi:MAG: hypothetical protein IKX00_04760 [Bacilli bacterium]|nr:hypothetical protein [Bacilli bacterium]